MKTESLENGNEYQASIIDASRISAYTTRLKSLGWIEKEGNSGHDPSNLVTACFTCNRSKRDKLVEEWM